MRWLPPGLPEPPGPPPWVRLIPIIVVLLIAVYGCVDYTGRR